MLLNLLLSVLNVSPLMCFGVDTAAVNAVGRAACRCVSAVVGHDIVHFGDGRVVCYKYLEIVGGTVHIVVGTIKAVLVDANAHARFALGGLGWHDNFGKAALLAKELVSRFKHTVLVPIKVCCYGVV